MKTVVAVGLAALAGAAFGIEAQTFTWRAEPSSALWNTTDTNWNDGVTWQNDNAAVFGESTEKNITVDGGDVWASSLTVNSGDYVFSTNAPASLHFASANHANGEQISLPLEVAEGASATFNNYPTFYALDALYKKGAGTLTLNGGYTGLQLIVKQGALRVTDCDVHTAKIYPDTTTTSTSLHLDGARIETWNANKTIGHPSRFPTATIGAKGFTLTASNASELWQCFATAPDIEKDGGIVKTGSKSLTILPQGTDVSTFNGGVQVKEGELIVANTNGLGTGAVVVSAGAGLVLTNAALTQARTYQLESKAVFGPCNGKPFTVDRPGVMPAFAASDEKHVLGLGRLGSGVAQMTFKPTADNATRLGGVYLSGVLDLTYGGVIKANNLASGDFFDASGLKSGSSVVLDQGGIEMDVPAETQVRFGLPLDTHKSNAVIEATATDDFEVDANGWSIASNGCADGNGSRSNNGGTFLGSSYPDYYTPDGSYFIYLRRKNSMSKNITIPSEGNWRVAFLMGSRPGYNSQALTVTVKFDDNEFVIPARETPNVFQAFATKLYPMTAGSKTVKITVGDGEQWTGIYIDRICLERIGDVEAPIVKTGAGELGIVSLVTAGKVDVSAGTLALGEATLNTGAKVDVAADATLALGVKGVNLVKNGSFEVPGGAEASWQFGCDNWSFFGRNNNSGGQNNGSIVAGDYKTPYGKATAYIRSSMQMSQSLTVSEAGKYVLSFVHSQRDYNQDKSYLNPISVLIVTGNETNEVVRIPPREKNIDYTRVTVGPIALAAGSHKLVFQNLGSVGNPDGAMVFIDDVSLCRALETLNVASGAEVALASGSTVRLDNLEKLVLPQGSVTVDGRAIQGNRHTLKAAGVNVTGEGKIQIGDPLGTFILIR